MENNLSLLLSFLLLLSSFSMTQSKIPRPNVFPTTIKHRTGLDFNSDSDFKTYFYTQRLDHFNYKPESYTTFKQKYIINYKYWGGSDDTNSPIFVYLGDEASLDAGIGFMTDNASRFKALLVYIEHRYYGDSMPFGSTKKAYKNASSLGYLNSAQAIDDYATVILHVKNKLSANYCPTIVIGGSYGGMLAAWFRLKYPHIALGALASSAPILYFEGVAPKTGYYDIVTKDFKETSRSCYETIRKSWAEIDNIASKSGGLAILSKKFKTCLPLKTSHELKYYLDVAYSVTAQYNDPSGYFISNLCDGIDGAPDGTDLIGRLFAGIVANKGKKPCYKIKEIDPNYGWEWMLCSEMVFPIAYGTEKDSMFPTQPFNLTSYVQRCKTKYGVEPQPHWVTTYYGGHDLKLILKRFGSNIIFSNGLRDPYSAGGVLENISDSILAVYTDKGSHCLDIESAAESDPEWLVRQRKTEVKIIEGWIATYYNDLKTSR